MDAMKPFRQILTAMGISLLFCTPALSDHTGPYLGLYGGANLLQSAESSDSQGTFNLEFDPAFQGSAVLGWDLKPGNIMGEGRFELEYARRSNTLDTVEFLEGDVPGTGDLTAESLLLNTWGVHRNPSRWTPYIGAGIGVARLSADDLRVTGQPLADDDDLVLAYQVGAGFDLALGSALALDFGYRFFGTTRPKFIEAGGEKFESEYFSHSAVLGLRLGF
jgi:opacity protein-like surface antigen